MNCRSGSAGAPCATTHALNAVQTSRCTRSYSARKPAHSAAVVLRPARRTRAGCPASGTSSGLQETMRTNGAPLVSSAGKHTTLSSTTTSGRTVARIWRSRGSQYCEPAMSASQVGLMNVSSC